MRQQGELPEGENAAASQEMARMFLTIARCPKPVVARIHGHALGGGTGLTAAADIAIASETAVFGFTEVKLGIVPAVISPFLIQKIGIGRARALFLTGERFDGREAERIGLVHRAVPEDQLDLEVARVVEEILTSGPAAVASAKRLIASVYRNICQGCHGPDGRGMDRIGPPLVGSALASAPAGLAARVILNGKEGEVGLMPPLGGTLSDEQIAGVLTYVRREWGGTGTPVDAATVARVRKATAGRARPWTRDELLALPAGSASGR
jgi:mono/diheme cytochrome c family protein